MGRSFKDQGDFQWEKKTLKSDEEDTSDVCENSEKIDFKGFSENQRETAEQFALLVRTMEDHFSLPKLLDMAQVSDLKNPFANLNLLLNSNIIVPDGKGYFTWDKKTFDKVMSC